MLYMGGVSEDVRLSIETLPVGNTTTAPAGGGAPSAVTGSSAARVEATMVVEWYVVDSGSFVDDECVVVGRSLLEPTTH